MTGVQTCALPILRQVRRREGRYLLRTNLTAQQPEVLWTFYIQLTEVEQAFKEIKHDLAIRPIFHKTEARIEAHIFVAFLAYCLQVTLKAKLRAVAGGTTPRECRDGNRATATRSLLGLYELMNWRNGRMMSSSPKLEPMNSSGLAPKIARTLLFARSRFWPSRR